MSRKKEKNYTSSPPCSTVRFKHTKRRENEMRIANLTLLTQKTVCISSKFPFGSEVRHRSCDQSDPRIETRWMAGYFGNPFCVFSYTWRMKLARWQLTSTPRERAGCWSKSSFLYFSLLSLGHAHSASTPSPLADFSLVRLCPRIYHDSPV